MKNLFITYCSSSSLFIIGQKISHLPETEKEKNCLQIDFQRARYTIRLSVSPSHPVITTSTDVREWKDRSSKRQIDMSSIRHDGYCRVENATHAHSRRSHTHVRSHQFCSVRKRTLVIRLRSLCAQVSVCLCATYTCRHMCVCTCRRAHAGLAAYIIVRLISVINILRTAITRRPACLRDINYG